MAKADITILVTLQKEFELTPAQMERWQKAAPGAEIAYVDKASLTTELAQRAEVWIGGPSMSMIARTQRLKWLQLTTAGADYHSAHRDRLPEGLMLTNASGAFGMGIAEYLMGTLLMLMRKLHLYRDNQSRGLWELRGTVRSVYGSTVLVLGMGDLGREFAQRAKAMGAYTIGVRRSCGGQKPDCFDEQHGMDRLDELLPRAQAVVLCLPGTPETQGLFDRGRLEKLREDAYLLNVGRGNAVDGLALNQQLQEGRLAGAVLDVTDPEPLPADHPLWKQENAIITPHCSGNFFLDKTRDFIVDIVADNLRRYLGGEPLRNVVDMTKGY